MAVLVGWDPTPTAPGDPAATRPTDDTRSLPVTATTPAAPTATTTPAIAPAEPAAASTAPTAGPATPAAARSAVRARDVGAHGVGTAPDVAAEGRGAFVGGRAGAPGTFVASDGRTVAWVSGARGALALVPAAPEQAPDTERGPVPSGVPAGAPHRGPAGRQHGAPGHGVDILPGVGFQTVPGVAFDPGQGEVFDPGSGGAFEPGPGVAFDPGPGVVPAVPRPQRRAPRDRRPVDPAPMPARRPAVAACEETYARRRFVALLAVAVASAAAVIGLGLLAASTGDEGVPDRTAIIEVRGGETLWDIASRVAPDSPRQAVVDRIRLLNGMQGSTLHPGQPLVVPTAG